MNGIERPPVTGAWQEGDPVGWRKFADIGGMELEFGGQLPAVRVAYETWGTLNADGNNAVLLEHALTGDAHAAGPSGPGQPTAGWWDTLVGPGRPIDTDRWFVVCANVLGGCQGTTGPASIHPDGKAWGSRWPRVSVRDQVEVERILADRLGIRSFSLVVGGSMGGMRALEWAVQHPQRVHAAVILATTAAASGDQIATQTAQVQAITADANWASGDYYEQSNGPHAGMQVARRFAHLTYRTSRELDLRFGRLAQRGEDALSSCVTGRHVGAGRFAVQSYLDHHGDKILHRFDPGSYVALTDCMTTHDVARGRGSLESVLGSIEIPVRVGGIDTDRLYPLAQQAELADLIPTCGQLDVIESPFGHDGFLIEADEVGRIVTEALADPANSPC